MDILFAIVAVFFMLLFLNSIRAIVKKDKDAPMFILFTSLLFGGLFWMLLYVLLTMV